MSASVTESRAVKAVIGTAGHIDHGKSSLVERLTGTHPSRLKEEQERGMTIDIGYAELELEDGSSVGIIDVPGHERFIRNMVAGAAGIDFVLLVVAADDGVMTQTREHVQILRLLGIQRGLTVLTKIDAVDDDLRELVAEELREFLQGTFLEDAPIMPVSNTTGAGIPELSARLRREIAELPPRAEGGVFRMPLQRSFSVKGHGTVVTGVPVSGSVRAGDELELLPAGKRVRVRGVQVHHQPAEWAGVGHRSALNVSDVGWREIARGDVLAAPGYFRAATLLEARLHYLDHHELPLRNDVAVRFHSGTTDVGGRVVILDRKVVLPGESALVQIRLDEPAVVAAGDRYVVRLASPVITLGGGLVVGETRWRFKRFRDWLNDNLEKKEAQLGERSGYLEYALRSHGKRPVSLPELARAVKEDEATTRGRLDELIAAGRARALDSGRAFVHADMLDAALTDVREALKGLHDADRIQAGFHRAQIAKASRLEPTLIAATVEELARRGRVEVLENGTVRSTEWTGGLTKEDHRLVTAIEAMHRDQPFAAPIVSEVVAALEKPDRKVRELMTWLQQMGRLVPLTPDLSLHVEAVREAERRLVERLLSRGSMPSKDFRDVIDASRKYVIPLLEHFDKKGITARDGNERTLTPDWRTRAHPETLAAHPDDGSTR